jgi:hypothetical protein
MFEVFFVVERYPENALALTTVVSINSENATFIANIQSSRDVAAIVEM